MSSENQTPKTSGFKDTLNLPRTEFPMKAELVAREPAFLERWEKEGLYARIQEKRQEKGRFILHDGPPFANGDVHMGTALNKVLKDFIVKSKTMMGFQSPYVPGWDCHGLPIEYKVVKSQADLSPVQIRKKCEEFARKYIDIQRRQFKRLGVLGDWERPYLTLDKKYEAEIVRLFGKMVDQELVYRSKKPVYWSTGAQTALAEAEVEYLEKDSPAVYVKFEVMGMSPQTFVAIWTTTPWTLPANLAVAINPRLHYAVYTAGDEKLILCKECEGRVAGQISNSKFQISSSIEASELLKLKLKHPFLEREAPILAADFVAADTGTGCVHIAPGHGQDDYCLGKHLGLLSPVDDQGCFTEECGVREWVGKYVFDANPDVIQLLKSKGTLLAQETIRHSYPHCWRSKTPIVFRAVEQWFIRLDAIKPKALQAIDKVEWIPSWGENRIRATVESRSDWCISRQRAWGVPLPIFYKPDGEAILDGNLIRKLADFVEKEGSNIWFEKGAEELGNMVGLNLPGLTKRNDTLDVWMDSGSSHQAVLKNKDFGLDFPADLYLEGSDQHRGWFQSSLLTSVAVNQGEAPYNAVVTNGFLVDLDGKKISKSGSYEKPKDADAFINKYGADIVRLWVASENYREDVPLSEEIFKRIGDTYRSIRNTLRILLANLDDFDPKDAAPWAKPTGKGSIFEQYGGTLIDRYFLNRLQGVIEEVRAAYEKYEFHKVYHRINAFCAVDVSALYVDITKDRLYCDAPDSPRRRATQTVMWEMAGALIRLLAPILSFTAEEAWGFYSEKGSSPSTSLGTPSVHLETMPDLNPAYQNRSIEAEFGIMMVARMGLAEELEKARQAKTIGKSIDAAVVWEVGSGMPDLRGAEKQLAEIFIVSQVEIKRNPHLKVPFTFTVVKPRGQKCGRCWKWEDSPFQIPGFGFTTPCCPRCAEAVRVWGEKNQGRK